MAGYSIAIDRNHDGDFHAAGEEIGGQVLELRWRLGLRQPYDSLADYSWGRISVRNPRGAFSPERHPLTSGTRVRIQSDFGGVKRTHFTGYISHIEPDEGDFSRKQAVIHLQDMLPWLEDSPARLGPQRDVRADFVIKQLLQGATLRRAVIAGFCLIDVPGYSQIDRVSVFPPQDVPRRLAVGKTRFAYVGDWWQERTSTRRAIGELVESERGRFFINRAGEAVFLNRHYTLTHKTIAARFADNMRGMEYSYGAQRVNRVSLLMRPREVGESDTVLWQLQQPQRLARNSETLLNLRLADGQGQAVGLLELAGLRASFQKGLAADSASISDGVQVAIMRVGAASVQVRLSNRNRFAVYLGWLQVLGKPLYRRAPLEVVAADGASLHVYGLKQLTLDLPALADLATAQAIATYEVARRKHPRGTIHRLRVDARQQPQAALRATLFDRIRVSDSQTGHGARDYFIIAEEHHVGAGGKQHEVTWTLEPADSARFVILDDSQVDDRVEVLAPY